MTLDFFDQLKRNVERTPDRVALQLINDAGRESFTFRTLYEEVSKLSRFLTRHIQPGDTVGILMQNHPRWGIAFLAAESAGARIVPFDVLHTPETLAGLIRHSRCTFLISSTQLSDTLDDVQSRLASPIPALVMGGDKPGCHSWDAVLREEQFDPDLPLVRRDPDDTFLLVYTSGTTGNPKGVMLSHRAIYVTVEAVLDVVNVNSRDHILSVLPLYHMLALMANFLMPLHRAAMTTYLDAVEPQRILKCFRDEGVSIFVCVPQFYYLVHRRIFQEAEKRGAVARVAFRAMLKLSRRSNEWLGWNPGRLLFRPVHRNFGSLRLFAVGGARFDQEVLKSFRDLGFQFAQAFGMTETSAVSTITDSGGLGSVGKAMPHVDVRIDQPAEDGIGEILIRGPHVMQSYWRNEGATREVLDNGWLHSGDLGYLDPDGYLYITGRKKDVIVLSSGKNIFPEEIEQAYESKCPYIKEMCVIGVEDGGQERLHAMIVPDFDYAKRQQVVNISDMLRYQLENLSTEFPGYKRVRSFDVLREPLPRTTTRKIKRFEIEESFKEKKEEVRDEAPAPAAQPRDDVERRVFQLLTETGKVDTIRHEMSLELDCGFDSLERVEFLSNVQDTFGFRIDDDAATEIFTLQDLIDAVKSSLSEGEQAARPVEKQTWSDILTRPLTDEEKSEIHRILRRRSIVEATYFGLSRIVLLAAKILFKIRFEGREKLPPQGALLICPNHLSYLDGFLLSTGLAFTHISRMFYVGYSSYFSAGTLTGYLGSLIKIVPVDPDRNLRQALRLGAFGLSEGYVLGIFPEGERSIDGEMKEFRKGPAILSKELEVPVVPTAIIGTFEVWPRGSSKVRLHPVTIRFGDPILPADDESYEEFNQRLRRAVQDLLDQDPPA